jgi:Luciferase-like monooxygenase
MPYRATRVAPPPPRATRRCARRRWLEMEYGAHLPLIAFDSAVRRLADLRAYTTRAAALGYRFLCANDHLPFARPWLDGSTSIAAVAEASDGMTLATTVALPVIRGPVQTAKMFAALDVLSDGRFAAGVGRAPRSARLRGRGHFVQRAVGTLLTSRSVPRVRCSMTAQTRSEGASCGRWRMSCGSSSSSESASRRSSPIGSLRRCPARIRQ